MTRIPYIDNGGNEFMADELLTCPCCGGNAVLSFMGNNHTTKRSTTIKCTKCFLKRTDSALRHSMQWCAEASIEQWNKRSNQDNI